MQVKIQEHPSRKGKMFTKWPNQIELLLTIGGKDVRESNRFKTT